MKRLLDQPDLGEPMFMTIVNLYYKAVLSSGSAAGSEQ